MKIKLFKTSIAIMREREIELDGETVKQRYITVPMIGPAFSDYADARRWCETQNESYSAYEIDADGTKTRKGWISNIVDVITTTDEEVIETEDFEEHKPTYQVELTVVQTKTFTVEVTPDDMEARGYSDMDEYDAGQCAEEMFSDDEFEYEYTDAYPDSTDVDADCIGEV